VLKRLIALALFASFPLLAHAAPPTHTKIVTGIVTHIKTDSPYPDFFHLWECKLRVTYTETEPDGDVETYVYKAYPKIVPDRVNRWMCEVPIGATVVIETKYRLKSPLRGEIVTLQIL
jgi:hypothetical protein